KNANPVKLSGAGRCPNVFGTGSYNVISYTSDSVQIEQFDPVSGDTLEGAFSIWNAITIYGEGDLVTGSDGLYYRSIASGSQNQNPISTPSQWEEVKFIGVWNTNVTYDLGDSVYGSDGILYRSLISINLANNPTTDKTNWGNSSIPEWGIGATYSIGDLVFGSNGFLYSSNTNSNIGNDPISDSTNWTNMAVQDNQIQSITASVASSELTAGLDPTTLDFRDATLTNGSIITVAIDTALSLVIPLDATLGTISAIQSRLILLAMNNAGTAELAIVNQSGGNNLDETTLISTTAIDATSDSATVIYSETARSNVSFRVVGYIESTQTVAGTWDTSPSTIQGMGGNALSAMNSIGHGQTWQNVTRSRVAGTTYYNTTGKPIYILITTNAANPVVTVSGIGSITGANALANNLLSFIVPPDTSYSLNTSFFRWSELS
ncbi:hypothetical protein KA005_44485, partial [bacterium]|nr:hypothetical protein [bacterium]